MQNKPGAIIIEGHVQGLSNTRSLGEAGIPVIIVDKNDCVARYSKYCSKFFRCPPFETDDLAGFLLQLAVTENLKDWVIIPSNDHAVMTISRNKKMLEKYYKVITPEQNIINKIYDKSKLLNTAIKVGVDVPETFYANDLSLENLRLSFPVLTKGKQGLNFYKQTGKKAFLARNMSELHDQLKHISKKIPVSETFTQELIPSNGINNTISFTVFCDNGVIKTYWAGEKMREHPVRFGTATFARSNCYDELLEPSKKLIKALAYTGVCEIEYLFDLRDNKYKLIEINARTWLWVGLAKACGVNYSKILYDFAQNNLIDFSGSNSCSKKWINWMTDIPFSVMSIIRGDLNLLQYFESLKGEKVDAVWCKNDKKPFFAYLFLLPFFKMTR